MTEEKKSRRLVEEFVIPKCSSRAFIVRKGQILRVIAYEGKQVPDLKFLNAHDYKEQFASRWSSHLNDAEGIGGQWRIKKLYSKPPWERVMMTVIDDKVGNHYFDGSCSPKLVEIVPDLIEGGKSCMDLFADCIRPYGLSLADLDSAGTFNIFMVVRHKDDEKGTLDFLPPSCEKGEYIDFLAEMDILVAATSCPCTDVVNDFKAKGINYQIFESY